MPQRSVLPEEDSQGPSQGSNHIIYQALPAGDYIRRLILEPSEEEDAPLFGRLEVFNLSQADHKHPFEAISYAWGSDVKDQTITINKSPMQITTSLRDSLRQTRQRDKPRALWADAICINQLDDGEKGHQVGLMGQIYKASRCTSICLGYSAELWPRQVASLVADVEVMIDRLLAGYGRQKREDLEHYVWPSNDDPLLTDERWHSWVKLLMQPWFDRGWVLQEAVLSPESSVLWDRVVISWMSILRVSRYAEGVSKRIQALTEGGRSYLPPAHTIKLVQDRPKDYAIFSTGESSPVMPKVDLLHLLHQARALKLKDPRDRIYAFMELPTTVETMPALDVSYGKEKSHLDVYREFATKYVAKSSDLDILSFAGHGNDDALTTTASLSCDSPTGHPGPDFTCPSWIPRWDAGPMRNSYRFIHAIGERRFDLGGEKAAIVNSNSILKVKAIIFDSVHYMSTAIRNPDGPRKNEAAVLEMVSLWRSIARNSICYHDPLQDGIGTAEAFLAALWIGNFSGIIGPIGQGLFRMMKDCAKLLEADRSQAHIPMDMWGQDTCAQQIALSGLMISEGFRFLVLGRGNYGVSPPNTREGDVCAIISGPCSPFILREVAGREGHYTLVGAAYVQSRLLPNAEHSGRLGETERHEDWRELSLPTRDIFLC